MLGEQQQQTIGEADSTPSSDIFHSKKLQEHFQRLGICTHQTTDSLSLTCDEMLQHTIM